jgi:phosphoribosylanthranilate isomerase
MYNPQIKASQITNLTDARYFAAWGVEWLGFGLESGQDHVVTPAQMAAIKEWVEGPKMVGEFSGLDIELIHQSVELLDLDGVEVSRFANLSELQLSIPIIMNIVMEAHLEPEALVELLKANEIVEYFILDFEKNATINDFKENFPTSWLSGLAKQFPIFIRTSTETYSLKELTEDIQPMGISLAGGEEEKVGLKSFDELDEIFEELEPLRMA